MMRIKAGNRIIRIAAVAVFVPALLLAARAAAAEPVGFVIEAVLATPVADSPIELQTMIDIEDTGHMLIIMSSGLMIRKDGPFHDRAKILIDAFKTPGDGDIGNGILSSLLELAKISQRSTDQLGGIRGAGRRFDVHAEAITPATKAYCFVVGTLPGFHTSSPPRRDEPLIIRYRSSPRGFHQAAWPVGVTDLPWPANWPAPEEGRYIWSVGGQVPAALWLRRVDALPESLVERAALYNDMRCYTQAIALIRQMMASAERR